MSAPEMTGGIPTTRLLVPPALAEPLPLEQAAAAATTVIAAPAADRARSRAAPRRRGASPLTGSRCAGSCGAGSGLEELRLELLRWRVFTGPPLWPVFFMARISWSLFRGPRVPDGGIAPSVAGLAFTATATAAAAAAGGERREGVGV